MVSRHGFSDLGFAKVDIDRQKRKGFPEVVYCPGKTKENIKSICKELLKNKQDLLLTRLDKSTFTYLKKSITCLKYDSLAKLGFYNHGKNLKKGLVVVMSAGTSDIPVAQEAVVTLEIMGNLVVRLFDVGVAGVHRLMHHMDVLRKAKVIVIVAGMEGALASLVSGLVSCPVVSVPTSCGYGASFGGLSALLTMLNSCSPGVAVVNIDNGFGAGYLASLINKG
ncbi:MAG: nickel pincer cofactor biosynthesis protein LarB [Candidatus Omnitrophica bacterium]|nr:nickel pincer cofactor biosynthesis protein LarB [Candidatus Omnitrophota bacterium]